MSVNVTKTSPRPKGHFSHNKKAIGRTLGQSISFFYSLLKISCLFTFGQSAICLVLGIWAKNLLCFEMSFLEFCPSVYGRAERIQVPQSVMTNNYKGDEITVSWTTEKTFSCLLVISVHRLFLFKKSLPFVFYFLPICM